MKKWKNLSKRGLALLLAFVTCISMTQITAFADGSSSGNGGYTTYSSQTSSLIADPSTADSYKTISWQGNEGKVWTDKSVVARDNDFQVTFSALSSAKQEISTQSKAIDVMLVLDLSASMTDKDGGTTTRLQKMVDAVNGFLGTIATPNSNPNTRVGITTFTFNAQDILPLAHYNSARLDLNGNNVTAFGNGKAIRTDLCETGTNIQEGIGAAMGNMGALQLAGQMFIKIIRPM